MSATDCLDLSEKPALLVPHHIAQHISAPIIKVSNNALLEIPKSLNLCRNLRELHVDGNLLSDLTDLVAKLPLLRILNAARNSLREVGKNFSSLTNLQGLYLSDNLIGQIHPFYCPKLEVMVLDDNRLVSVPRSLLDNKTLKILKLARNGITSIPEEIWNLENLNVLSLAYNPLVHFPVGISLIRNNLNICFDESQAKVIHQIFEEFTKSGWRKTVDHIVYSGPEVSSVVFVNPLEQVACRIILVAKDYAVFDSEGDYVEKGLSK